MQDISKKVLLIGIGVMAFMVGFLSWQCLKQSTEVAVLRNHIDKYCTCYACKISKGEAVWRDER